MPVNYLREDGLVFIEWMVFGGVSLRVKVSQLRCLFGERVNGHAKTVLDRPDYVSDIFKRLRPKVPAWLPRWLNGKLIVIEVSDA